MRLTPQVAEAARLATPAQWDNFREEMVMEATNRFVGSKDPSRALAFFAEVDAIRRIVNEFYIESEKKHKNNS